uniref:Uncharacterized protein n=1 Tax=Cricetulus griseus TaxID=10029 RepID=A0A8C2MPS7_CRIGR
MWFVTLGFQILFRNLHKTNKTTLLCSDSIIRDSFLNLSCEHKEERRDYRWRSQAEPLASERFTVINHRCVPAAGAGRLHKYLRLHTAPATGL